MDYGTFRTQVAAFLKRKDLAESQLDFFINTAKLKLQRLHNFDFAVKKVTLAAYPATAGEGVALPDDFKGFRGEFAVTMTNAEGGALPLKGGSLSQENRKLRVTGEAETDALVDTAEIEFYCEGQDGAWRLFLSPEIEGAVLEVWYYAFLPDYSSITDTDAILKFGFDALLWESLKVANTYLQEEERIQIDDALAEKALNDLLEWSCRVSGSGRTLDGN